MGQRIIIHSIIPKMNRHRYLRSREPQKLETRKRDLSMHPTGPGMTIKPEIDKPEQVSPVKPPIKSHHGES